MFFRIKKAGGYEYVQVVENKRVDGVVHQHVLASLGRADHLLSSGKLASLVASGAKLLDQIAQDYPPDSPVKGDSKRASEAAPN